MDTEKKATEPQALSDKELDKVTGGDGDGEFGILDKIADGIAAVFGRDGQGRNIIHHFTHSGTNTKSR
jgi:hypothetical protein